MHEWALAEGVIDTTVKVSREKKLKEISRVVITLGELQQIDEEIFKFALREIIKPTSIFKKTEFKFEKEKAVLRCKVCTTEWEFGDMLCGLDDVEVESIHFIPEMSHIYMKCPGCGSRDFEIVKGRGVWIASIEGME
ncbi:MAG: hydrogenase nickel insertion protein HypA [bacterium (Candidatus Stahlbacteria) CG08_land_8_20_14_0_20_40_26]|nr:MAG: hydrogenase nickel insertion protein HypA [bacterium (Candidatus Stahlbacteria) CG23_combo_of_CG06-09_8_20_14_all_40_9]PIS24599.1 MAG: hydrogenase nickel insertion protein HypA [bacterium (Candidatus Stahlbacteria) CG08_land_8_20_14_0_20_40_26]